MEIYDGGEQNFVSRSELDEKYAGFASALCNDATCEVVEHYYIDKNVEETMQ